jgi:hypothetical protein
MTSKPPHLGHFYPVLPMRHIAKSSEEASLRTAYHSLKKGDALFTIQGNFGGVHKHRKDPVGVLNCLREIEAGRHKCEQTNQTSKNPGEGHLRVSHSDHHALNIDLIGRVNDDMKLGTLKHGNIRVMSGLSSPDFFAAISQARFMITAIRDPGYSTSKATSSVPAALITEIPLVTTRSFLQLYPCLRDAPMHRYINRNENECDSIHTAAGLSEIDYHAAKAEVQVCGQKLYYEAKETFKSLMLKY